MARDYISVILCFVLVAMHVEMSVSIGERVIRIFPMGLPVVQDGFSERPLLLTSGAASVIQPAVNLVPVVNSILPTDVFMPPGGRFDPSVGRFVRTSSRPGLPPSFIRVRQPQRQPTSPQTPGTADGHKDGVKDWSYDDTNELAMGPRQWHKQYPKCGRPLQSPLDIYGSTIKYRAIPPMIMRTVDGRGTTTVRIKNDGASVSVKPTMSNVILEGGALPGRFVVTNIHFHWSVSDMVGSEHKLQGRSYPLEMHLVTFNSKYRNMQEASGANDGIHVVAVLYEISKRRNVALNFCTSKMDGVIEPGSEIDGGTMNVNNLLPPSSVPFYRYRGSLTTPPCTENILWTVYAHPQRISSEQLNKFRSLKLGTKVQPYLGTNGRPVQSMGNRVIYTNNRVYPF